ncbi:MAG: translation initiation factor IF-1, partial [Bryobacteraceae bacterium]
MYRVELDSKQHVLAHAAGVVKRNFVRLLPGDRVEVVLAPRDWTRGRITRRLTG